MTSSPAESGERMQVTLVMERTSGQLWKCSLSAVVRNSNWEGGGEDEVFFHNTAVQKAQM